MRRRTDFGATVRCGRRIGGPAITLHIRGDRVDDGHPLLPSVGFVVPRSVGSAVVRNRVRRRLRHLIRARLAQIPPSVELVVRVSPAATRLDGAGLAAALDRGLARAFASTAAPQ